MATTKEEKTALSSRQCTVSQVDRNGGKTIGIPLQITSVLNLFSRFGPQLQLAISRPRKNGQRKEIWLQWRSDVGNCGVFDAKSFDKKGMELVEKHCNQCITLKGDYVDK